MHAFMEHLVTYLELPSPTVYLEFGIGSGDAFNRLAPHFHRAVAVDKEASCLEYVKHQGNLEWFHGTTDEFIEHLQKSRTAPIFSMVYIDAWHSFEQVMQDFLQLFKSSFVSSY